MTDWFRSEPESLARCLSCYQSKILCGTKSIKIVTQGKFTGHEIKKTIYHAIGQKMLVLIRICIEEGE